MHVEVISVAQLREQGGDLFAAHGVEVDPGMPVEVNWALYTALEAAGALWVLGLYDDGELVGYSSSIVSELLNAASVLVFQNTAIYATPAARRGGGGALLLRKTIKDAEDLGAHFVQFTAPTWSPLGSVLQGMNFKARGVVYSKEL